jgi:hypothetical protein
VVLAGEAGEDQFAATGVEDTTGAKHVVGFM